MRTQTAISPIANITINSVVKDLVLFFINYLFIRCTRGFFKASVFEKATLVK